MSTPHMPARPGHESCPYGNYPDRAFWRRAPGDAPDGVVPRGDDAVWPVQVRIESGDRISSAGSCFAQHIARWLVAAGLHYQVTEPGHPVLTRAVRERFQYGLYSARYGNVYTARQWLQLVQRALGQFEPREPPWRDAQGRWIDPFRPHVQPRGFATREELEADRTAHLRAVRKLLQTHDVWIFTLGLTEAWVSQEDGAVFPVCPGCGAGQFDPARHRFVNFGVDEVVDDLRMALELMRSIQPSLRCLLTVSPVPLVATATGAHVLTATVASKSVLRVAAGQVAQTDPLVDYFPSYEWISTGAPWVHGEVFAADRRTVRPEAVAQVMQRFLRYWAGCTTPVPAPGGADGTAAGGGAGRTATLPSASQQAADLICDEQFLDSP